MDRMVWGPRKARPRTRGPGTRAHARGDVSRWMRGLKEERMKSVLELVSRVRLRVRARGWRWHVYVGRGHRYKWWPAVKLCWWDMDPRRFGGVTLRLGRWKSIDLIRGLSRGRWVQ